jgi:hypothetical protein
MSNQKKKEIEIFYAEKTSQLLGESWRIVVADNENDWPDLIVSTELQKFGLEVREIYFDETKTGSPRKAKEKNNLKAINDLADAYYKRTLPPIRVSFLCDIIISDLLLQAIINAAGQLSERQQMEIEPYNGCRIIILRLPDSMETYKRWEYINDRIGWVRNVDKGIIEKFIFEKAQKLTKYNTFISDVRLLLVSNRMFSSGKAELAEHNLFINTYGFNEVYYLSYPDAAFKLRRFV